MRAKSVRGVEEGGQLQRWINVLAVKTQTTPVQLYSMADGRLTSARAHRKTPMGAKAETGEGSVSGAPF